jgi:hypothetical protein
MVVDPGATARRSNRRSPHGYGYLLDPHYSELCYDTLARPDRGEKPQTQHTLWRLWRATLGHSRWAQHGAAPRTSGAGTYGHSPAPGGTYGRATSVITCVWATVGHSEQFRAGNDHLVRGWG